MFHVSKRRLLHWRDKMKLRSLYAAALLSAVLTSQVFTAAAEESAVSADASQDVSDLSEQIEAARQMDTTGVADASDMTTVEEVGDPQAAPVSAGELLEGEYEIAFECSSSMFKIRRAILKVKEGKMTVDLEMDGEGYLFLYPGSPEEAAKADAGSFLYFDVNDEGYHVFRDYPLEALNTNVPCAAFSKKKEQWYARTLFFKASSLEPSAFAESQGNTAESVDLADGVYTIDSILGNAGGKTALESSVLTVADGKATVKIEFNTAKFDYVKVDGVQYDAVPGEENAVFEFPVSVFDTEIPMIADSTAIQGMNVEKEFTITFPSETIKAAE